MPRVGERWTAAALRRVPGLMVGLVLCGVAIAMMAQANLGLGPWEAFHQGISRQTGIPLGTVSILFGVPILLAWLPLGQRPGPGTILNIITVGTATNVAMAVLPVPADLPYRLALMAGGVVMMGIATGLYLSADLGPGPRDGLMTGVHHRFGWSIARARTVIEVTVLVAGFLLGGTIGLGTIVFAFGIGPVVQASLRVCDPEGRVMRRRREEQVDPMLAEGAA
ncbi:MAG: YitT family protein [Chloroflexi bacterium]|nr:YitT family protein [Chloroflexota bacterium]